MKSDPENLLKRHDRLVQSDMLKVTSHVQRAAGEWIINTVMVEGCEAPFKFKRRQQYKNLTGARINVTYYPGVENVAGFELEVMNVVRIKIA